jgi:ribose 5-phosphate isomerase B
MRDPSEADVRRLVREAVERALGPTPGPAAGVAGRAPAASPGPASVASGVAPARRAPGGGPDRTVALGADHGGYELKETLKRYVTEELGWAVQDCGTHSRDAVDYPDVAAAVARAVAGGACAFGIVVDAAGIGSSMAANKVAGVRCAVCHDDATVLNAREHNDANVLSLGARIVPRGAALKMARLFLSTPFGGGRHERRVQKIMALERGA